jgi:hypothetical protein
MHCSKNKSETSQKCRSQYQPLLSFPVKHARTFKEQSEVPDKSNTTTSPQLQRRFVLV